MNTSYVPGTQDSGMKVENAITKSAAFAGTPFDLGNGFAPGGIGMPLALVTDVSTILLGGSAGASSFTLQLCESPDNNSSSTWTPCGPSITVSSAGVLSVPGIVSQRYVCGSLGLAGATGTGTITLSSWLSPQGFAVRN